MKKIVCLAMGIILVVCLAACGNSGATNQTASEVKQEEPSATANQTTGIEVDEGLFNVTITIPSDFIGEITQEELDAKAEEGNYKSAKLNADGSVTYIMSQKQHAALMEQLKTSVEEGLQEIIDDENYSIESIEHNNDFTVFDVTLSTSTLGFQDSFTALAFYMYGGMYGAFSGDTPDDIIVNFKAPDGSIIETGHSAAMGSAAATEPAEDFTTGRLYSDMEESGVGTMYISTPGGTSENGATPILYANSYDMLIQIGLNAWDFDGSLLSFVYVDGVQNSKEQLANTQTSISLSGSMLAPGIHYVEVVQYENNDEAGTIVTYKLATYEVQSKD